MQHPYSRETEQVRARKYERKAEIRTQNVVQVFFFFFCLFVCFVLVWCGLFFVFFFSFFWMGIKSFFQCVACR